MEKDQVTSERVKPAPDKASLPKWSCEFENSPSGSGWTVGEIIQFECQGPSVDFADGDLQFRHQNKGDTYKLRILEVKSQTANKLQMQATSYIPGEHEFKTLFIAEAGEKRLEVEALQLVTESVIEEEEAQPFGAMVGLSVSYPLWMWLVLGTFILLTAFLGLFRFRRRRQMKKVMEELQQHNTALGAFNQFNKDFRKLGREFIFGGQEAWSEEKKHRYVESLNEIFRMYLLREFFVPALDWEASVLLKTLSQVDKKGFRHYEPQLKEVLSELDQALENPRSIQVNDCKQLGQMATRVSQKIWKVRGGGK